MRAYPRASAQQFAATEAPSNRNGNPLTRSTLVDPHLSEFLNSIPSILPSMPLPDPFITHTEKIPHDEVCSYCVYYDYQDRFSSTRPIRNNFRHCNLRTRSRNVCEMPSLFFCHVCLHMICRECQNFFSNARDEAEYLQHRWSPTITRPLTIRRFYANHTGPVHPHSFFDTPVPLILPHQLTTPTSGTLNEPITISSDDEQAPQLSVLLPQRRRRSTPIRTLPGTTPLHLIPNFQPSSTPHPTDYPPNLCTSLASLSLLHQGLPQGGPLPTWIFAATRDLTSPVSPRQYPTDDDESADSAE